MFTAQDISALLDRHLSGIDARFIPGVEHDGHVDIELDDAIIRVALNQQVVKTFTVSEREVLVDRKEIFNKYAAPAIAEFVMELQAKAKKVVVLATPILRRDPSRQTVTSENASTPMAVSSLMGQKGEIQFILEMKFGTFNV